MLLVIQNIYPQLIKNVRLNLLLLIYILMDTFKNYTNINDLSDKACFPNKTEDLNTNVFNMITRKNELKISTQHAPCKCECRLDGRKSNLNQNWNNYKCWWKSKKHHISIKYHIWNRAACSCKNSKYYASIIDDSVIPHDEIMEATNFNKKQGTCKIK